MLCSFIIGFAKLIKMYSSVSVCFLRYAWINLPKKTLFKAVRFTFFTYCDNPVGTFSLYIKRTSTKIQITIIALLPTPN